METHLLPPRRQTLERSQTVASSVLLSESSSLTTETSVLQRDVDPATGKKMVNQYLLVKELGRGFNGKVKLALDMDTNTFWAIKIVERTPRRRGGLSLSQRFAMAQENSMSNPHLEKLKREIAILKKCRHSNIVHLQEVIDDPRSDKIYLILEYLTGGEVIWRDGLSETVAPVLSLEKSRSIFRDLVAGLLYLHEHGIIHRDIKPANLLWTVDHRVKISDFGTSIIHAGDDLTDTELAKATGSPAFLAPEICGVADGVSDDEVSETLTPIDPYALDVWAAGVTLYCLIFGRLPFEGTTEFEVFHAINNKPITLPPQTRISNDLKNLLFAMLDKNPKTRIQLPQIQAHPWVIHGLSHQEQAQWLYNTHPHLDVSDADVKSALTVMDRLKKGLITWSERLFQSRRVSKRAVSMPSISVSNLPSSTTRQPSSFRSPSTPPIIPYLPASIETSVEKIKREKSRRFKYISDTNSVVTDLADSPWTAWDDEKLRAPSIDPMHDEMERIHNWASSLSIQEETIPDTNSPN